MKRSITSAALLVCTAAAFAGDTPAPKTLTSPVAAGQMIFVDPGTGEVRQPTIEEWSQLPRPIAPKARTSPQQVLPDGTIYIPAEAVMQRMTATVGDDGKVRIDCDDEPVAP